MARLQCSFKLILPLFLLLLVAVQEPGWAMGLRRASSDEISRFETEFRPYFEPENMYFEGASVLSGRWETPSVDTVFRTLERAAATNGAGVDLSSGVISLKGQFFKPYTDQGLAGACLLFSNTALFEAAYFRETGRRVDFSEMWILRNRIGRQLYQMRQLPGFSESYVGVRIEEWKSLAVESGVCNEPLYPYRGNAAAKLEWEYRAPADPSIAHALRVGLFADIFDKSGPPVACRDQGRGDSEVIRRFTIHRESVSTLYDLFHLIAAGIPVSVTLHRADNGERLGPGHKVVLTGFDLSRKRFLIRNSWGAVSSYTPLSSDSVSFRLIETAFTRHPVRDPEAAELEFVSTPADHRRLCAVPELAPSPIRARCAESALE